MLLGESDPTSPLWVGHTSSGDYLYPRMIQPSDRATMLSRGLKPGELQRHKIVFPSDVRAVRSKMVDTVLEKEMGSVELDNTARESSSSEDDEESEYFPDQEKGAKEGGHWFEVVPRNKVHNELIAMTIR
jgi:hypothetical protein